MPTPATKKSISPLRSAASQTADVASQYPFLLKATITVLVHNQAGVEEKRVMPAVFQIDAASAKMPAYVLANYLVPQYLNEKMGPKGQGWKKIYEIKINKLVNRLAPDSVEGIPLRFMTTEQLGVYVARKELPIKIELFHNVEYARQMIALYEEDPKGYQKQLADYNEGKKRKYPELDKLRKNLGNATADHLTDEFDSLEKDQPKTPAPAPSKVIETEKLSAAEQKLLEPSADEAETGAAAADVPADAPATEEETKNPFDNV